MYLFILSYTLTDTWIKTGKTISGIMIVDKLKYIYYIDRIEDLLKYILFYDFPPLIWIVSKAEKNIEADFDMHKLRKFDSSSILYGTQHVKV